MEKAKAAVSNFVSKDGKHHTTVDERQAPAVQREVITPTRHENITTAVDREVHQDHHHTTVQPVKDREILPEKHDHQMAPVQHKEYEHANPRDVKARLDHESNQFKDTSTTLNTKSTQAASPTVEGERVHHHVHETIQPLIEKETIAPSVVHTTVPIHETHHAAPEHHGTSVLPTKTMADFRNSGHELTGSSGITNHDQYDGCPRPYKAEMQIGHHDNDGIGSHHGLHHGSTNAGPHHSNLGNKADPRVDSDLDGQGIGAGTGLAGTHGSHDTTGPHHSDLGNKADPRVDSDRDGRGIGAGTGLAGTHGSHDTAGPHHSDLGNKADPRVDSDRDGRGIGTGAAGTGLTGTHGSHNTAGPHSSDTHNTLDPRVDGTRSHTGAGSHLGGATGHDSHTPHDNYTSAHGSGVGDSTTHKKPSLIDRLNPMKDSDGDGKKGFMK